MHLSLQTDSKDFDSDTESDEPYTPQSTSNIIKNKLSRTQMFTIPIKEMDHEKYLDCSLVESHARALSMVNGKLKDIASQLLTDVKTLLQQRTNGNSNLLPSQEKELLDKPYMIFADPFFSALLDHALGDKAPQLRSNLTYYRSIFTMSPKVIPTLAEGALNIRRGKLSPHTIHGSIEMGVIAELPSKVLYFHFSSLMEHIPFKALQEVPPYPDRNGFLYLFAHYTDYQLLLMEHSVLSIITSKCRESASN